MKLGDTVFYRDDRINNIGWTVGKVITIRRLKHKFNNTKITNCDIDTPYGIIREIELKFNRYDRTTLL